MHDCDPSDQLAGLDLFKHLGPFERAALGGRFENFSVRRGDVLVRQGDEADALYIAVSGRFGVARDGRPVPNSDISAGQPIGEIAFLSGSARTATVTALRDGQLLRLTRERFDELVAETPSVWPALASTLAQRLARTTAALKPSPDVRPRTIAVIRAGQSPVTEEFFQALHNALSRHAETVLITPATAVGLLGTQAFDSGAATAALNALEARSDVLLLATDATLTPWSMKAIRQADLVIAAGRHSDDPSPNELETFAGRYLSPQSQRLVLLHKTRARLSGTQRWLKDRIALTHHHVALDRSADIERLVRFITCTARGLVACGGGALGAAHTGIYKALVSQGFEFDIMGGASVGAAMTAAFMLTGDPDHMDAAIHEMFVTRRAMRRYTLPKYALLDHRRFDEELERLYGSDGIEDLWLPFFAVSSNLSRYQLQIHRQGSLWQAIRASASIPVLLPPVYTDDGEMLTDGGLLDNVPLSVMHAIKSGPNAVISFMPLDIEHFDVDYAKLPSRMGLVRHAINPMTRGKLPEAPNLLAVLLRAIMANRNAFKQHLTSEDLLLVPPIPRDIGLLDWHRHRELYELGHAFGKNEAARLMKENPEVVAAFTGS